MLLYLTGASTSLVKSSDSPQTDANKSLGGYFSSTPVPNAALNSLFDTISSYTMEKHQGEIVAIGLINRLKVAVTDVELKVITVPDNLATFKVAAVAVSPDDYRMEAIANRYQEPMLAEFHDASFHRASVDVEITQYASAGEEIMLYPFNLSLIVDEEGWEGTWKAFKEAFSSDQTYDVVRVSERVYRITRRDDTALETPLECSYIATDGFAAEFKGELANAVNNTALLAEALAPGDAVGIWIQRNIKDVETSDEQLIEDFKQGVVQKDVEEVELVVSYNRVGIDDIIIDTPIEDTSTEDTPVKDIPGTPAEPPAEAPSEEQDTDVNITAPSEDDSIQMDY